LRENEILDEVEADDIPVKVGVRNEPERVEDVCFV
jgi:hypothetical protein